MLRRLAVPFIALAAAGPAGAAPALGQEPDYPVLWASGQPYSEFYAAARGRRSLWERNTERAEVSPEVLVRARVVGGPWRLLVVAFDGCSDSVNTIPFIAALVDSVDGLEMRIIPPGAGRPIMDAHRTPDGRAATPTVLLLDGAWQPAGAWVERPSELQEWYITNPDDLSVDQRYFEKMLWYDRDAGVSTVEEVVELLERAGGERPMGG